MSTAALTMIARPGTQQFQLLDMLMNKYVALQELGLPGDVLERLVWNELAPDG